MALIWIAAVGAPAAAQTWDTSGNGQLSGNYYFREIIWQGLNDQTNNLQVAGSVYGTISFDGQGHYTLSGAQEYDSQNFVAQPYTLSQPGTFSIAASGYGFIDSPLIGSTLNVLVSNGVVIGSSTDNGTANNTPYNDLFIAAPVQSNPSFQGAYSVSGVDSPTLGVADTRAYTFPFTANGTTGSPGTVRFNGAFAGTNQTTDSISGVNFHFSGGAAVVQFGGELNNQNVDSHFMAGTKYFYFSPDGNFFFGGSPTGWDMILGVRGSGTAVAFNQALYYVAGLTQDDSTASAGFVNLTSGYGSMDVLQGGTILEHQRVLRVDPRGSGPYDFTYSDAVAPTSGVYADSFSQYTLGPGGVFGIGFSKSPGLGIEVLVQAPPSNGTGVYVFPTGVVNAGSLAPFTASWAPGELVSIFGTNLANTTATNGALPTTLAGVQVMVNNTAAPIYFVSPGQINAVIPLATTSSTASLQVINNGSPSNTVMNYVAQDQSGVFNSISTIPAVQHGDYTMVTPASPAKPGETILIYLTGLGTLDTSGNATEFATSSCSGPCLTASIGGLTAPVAFAGSQSAVGGGYQMNVTVPATLTSGTWYLDISGTDSYNSETQIPVSTTGAAVAQDRPQAVRRTLASPGLAKSRRRPPMKTGGNPGE